ncbi:MAG: HAMP domain-containing sensor histidine kinase, partial [Spirochaetaceae bacterium]|nr:HAMP domain-containing sensor histidine kinase [Spirochaetaceae bacterium]
YVYKRLAGACVAAAAGEAPARRWHAAAGVVAAGVAVCAWAGWWGGGLWLAPAAGVAALAAYPLRRWSARRPGGAAGRYLCAIGLLPVAGALVDQVAQLTRGAPLSLAVAGAGAAALGAGYLLAELDYLRAPAGSCGAGRKPDFEEEGLLQQRLAIAGYLTTGVAHEFKNTLGHIKTTAEWGAAGGDPQRALQLIRSHVGDGVSGVNEMLTTTLRDGPEARSKVSLLSEINKILGVVAATLQVVRITIRLQVPAELVLVTRRSELMLALLNLIHNAGQATTEHSPGGGAVTVTGREEADRCILEVTDGAGGVDPAAVGTLFDRGYGTGAGSGVGLHLARRLVERNNGSLTYHAIPGGSCFRIALPMEPSPGGVGAVRGG